MVGFGIAIQSTLPGPRYFNFDLFRSIMNNAYWAIYGQIENLDCINSQDTCNTVEFQEMNQNLLNFDFILLIAYLIIVLILLQNVLIAKFK